jgi:glycosyltransferase involved in cell wall biosynthesis
MKLSIIIPTLNEERFLPGTLKSIIRQDFCGGYEIIVVDNHSIDETRKIASECGCLVVDGGLPAAARNNGARVANGEYLLFLDADVRLTDNFLQSLFDKIKKHKIAVGGGPLFPFDGDLRDKIMESVFNAYNFATQYFYPHAQGAFIFSRKDIHKKIGGFREDLAMCEDHNYVWRASKISRFKFILSPTVLISTRRFQADGRSSTFWKYLSYEISRWFKGDRKTDNIEYRYGHYSDNGDKK